MSILLSTSELASFQSGIYSHFQTFAGMHNISIIKEPQKIIIDNNANIYPGYESNSNLDNFTYVPVTGQFPGMVMPPSKFDSELFALAPVKIVAGDRILKVEKPAKDFLDIGQTERIIVDGIDTYTLQSQGYIKTFGSLTFYYFVVQKTS